MVAFRVVSYQVSATQYYIYSKKKSGYIWTVELLSKVVKEDITSKC